MMQPKSMTVEVCSVVDCKIKKVLTIRLHWQKKLHQSIKGQQIVLLDKDNLKIPDNNTTQSKIYLTSTFPC